MAGAVKSRSVAILSVLSILATLLSAAPLPAAASSHAVANAAQLAAALGPGGPAEIEITTSFTLTSPVTIGRNVTIYANGATAESIEIKAPPNSPAFMVAAGNTVTLRSFGIWGANDRRAKGGGIAVDSGATLIVDMMSIHDNFAGEGGGIYNAGTTTIKNSVFYRNSAAGKGGGISNDGTLNVENSTFAKNDAQQGGAASTAGAASFNFVTIVGNSSKNKIGAGTHLTGGSITLSHSIVANNFSGGSFYDCSGQTTVNRVLFSSTQGC
ncbi:MAG: hypothetical protein OEM40_00160, partial [Acidimicrobiia bacterium]|nr:hypothetical protein [Acidimicrobiia bacterium]